MAAPFFIAMAEDKAKVEAKAVALYREERKTMSRPAARMFVVHSFKDSEHAWAAASIDAYEANKSEIK